MATPNQVKDTPTTDVIHDERLTQRVDLYRFDACQGLGSRRRFQMGQFFTPPTVARFMASLFREPVGEIRLLDAGAGVGTLTAAFVCGRAAIGYVPFTAVPMR